MYVLTKRMSVFPYAFTAGKMLVYESSTPNKPNVTVWPGLLLYLKEDRLCWNSRWYKHVGCRLLILVSFFPVDEKETELRNESD